jgi:hypothetical protein
LLLCFFALFETEESTDLVFYSGDSSLELGLAAAAAAAADAGELELLSSSLISETQQESNLELGFLRAVRNEAMSSSHLSMVKGTSTIPDFRQLGSSGGLQFYSES